MGSPFVEGKDGENLSAAYYHSANRGKRSIVADLKTEEGQELVRRLVKTADVVIENFKLGGLVKYGLDYESLKKVNPRIVYCSITGFGQTGPYAGLAGYDYIVQGMSGFMSITGEPDGQPVKAGVAIADIFTGIYAVSAIEAALIHALKSGEGQLVDMALLDVQSAVLANQNMNYLISGKPPVRLGNAHPNICPTRSFRPQTAISFSPSAMTDSSAAFAPFLASTPTPTTSAMPPTKPAFSTATRSVPSYRRRL